MFKDITEESGISYLGSSYGSAWADFNNDGFADLWVSNHGSSPILYQNQGNGTFIDITQEIFGLEINGDLHGAAWADFDNDGDRDLLQLIGGEAGGSSFDDPKLANLLFINQDGTLINRGLGLGLGYIGSRGRTPLWFDRNNNGSLDLLQGAASRSDGEVPATIFSQQGGEFINLQPSLDFNLDGTHFGILSDLVGDNSPELVILQPRDGISIYDSATVTDITDSVLTSDYKAQDFISEDFNGDLLPDLYLTRQGLGNSGLFVIDSQTLNLRLQAQNNQQGVTFKSEGVITLDIFAFGYGGTEIDPENIFLGASGLNAADLNISEDVPNGVTTNLEITLDPQDLELQGFADFTPGEAEGLYIGYDTDLEEWRISLSTPNQDLVAAIVKSDSNIDSPSSIGFDSDRLPQSDHLLINNGNMLIDETLGSGINTIRNAGVSTVAGDFDNDMDVDLYVVTASIAGNEPNVLYDNQGDGTFIPLDDLNDGFGTSLGVGESVSTSDYNNDGFLDLFVTNGSFPSVLVENAPYQLLVNEGNDNNWLEVDLEGTTANRDGIGAKVYVTAGGKTQLRQQSGGMHNRVQNDSRLHFGLADNTSIEEITVEWTSGTVQTIENIDANQIIEITENI